MRRLVILAVLIVVLIVGGGLTSQLASSNSGPQLPVLKQTDNPDGSPETMTAWKAEQLVLIIMFLLFSPFPPGLIPMAIGIMVLMIVLDWGVKSSKKQKAASPGLVTVAPDQPTSVESS
ncbi:MAG: hypothetical protein ABI690_17770 [Chloroflexota bacterium]